MKTKTKKQLFETVTCKMGLCHSVNLFCLLYTISNNIGIYVYISYVFVHSRQLNCAKLIVLREN